MNTPPLLRAEDTRALLDAQRWLIDHPHASLTLEGRPGEWFACLGDAPPSEAHPTIADAIRAALREVTS